MDLDTLIANQRQIVAILAAMSVFALTLTFAWPYLAQNTAARRLRQQIAGPAQGAVVRKADPGDPASAQPAGLRARQSASLARLVAAFRFSDRLNDGEMVSKLQQAGYRGRPAAVQYLACRIISPLVLLGLSMLFVLVLWPHQSLLIQIAVVAGGTVFGWFLPPILLKNRIDRRKVEIGRAWPDAVDLMLICVETGMSIEHAFRKVAEGMASTSIELAKEMSLTNAELNYLKERRQAYENLARRVKIDAVQAVTGCLIQSERYGTSLGHSLRVLAQESRAMRMAAAEKKAAALPPKLTVPMILFFLPVLFAVIITPAILQIMKT
jgi:tight adherence protein C